MKRIELTKGQHALVDDADFEFLNQWKWRLSNRGYAVRGERKNGIYKTIFIHRELLATPEGFITDHINGDCLDNRRSNLRVVTHRQNAMNRQKDVKTISQFKGVSFYKKLNKWGAHIFHNNRLRYLGLFEQEHHAALAYDLWAKELFGPYAKTNFQSI